MHATGWSRGLEVTGGGSGVVSHAGLVLLRQLADRAGLTAGLSAALPSPLGGHDRGRVLSDLACAIADGARVISDFRVMGDQRELFGPVASVPTAWRALKETAAGGDRRRRKMRPSPAADRSVGAGAERNGNEVIAAPMDLATPGQPSAGSGRPGARDFYSRISAGRTPPSRQRPALWRGLCLPRWIAGGPSALLAAAPVPAVRKASTIAAMRAGSETRARCPPW